MSRVSAFEFFKHTQAANGEAKESFEQLHKPTARAFQLAEAKFSPYQLEAIRLAALIPHWRARYHKMRAEDPKVCLMVLERGFVDYVALQLANLDKSVARQVTVASPLFARYLQARLYSLVQKKMMHEFEDTFQSAKKLWEGEFFVGDILRVHKHWEQYVQDKMYDGESAQSLHEWAHSRTADLWKKVLPRIPAWWPQWQQIVAGTNMVYGFAVFDMHLLAWFANRPNRIGLERLGLSDLVEVGLGDISCHAYTNPDYLRFIHAVNEPAHDAELEHARADTSYALRRSFLDSSLFVKWLAHSDQYSPALRRDLIVSLIHYTVFSELIVQYARAPQESVFDQETRGNQLWMKLAYYFVKEGVNFPSYRNDTIDGFVEKGELLESVVKIAVLEYLAIAEKIPFSPTRMFDDHVLLYRGFRVGKTLPDVTDLSTASFTSSVPVAVEHAKPDLMVLLLSPEFTRTSVYPIAHISFHGFEAEYLLGPHYKVKNYVRESSGSDNMIKVESQWFYETNQTLSGRYLKESIQTVVDDPWTGKQQVPPYIYDRYKQTKFYVPSEIETMDELVKIYGADSTQIKERQANAKAEFARLRALFSNAENIPVDQKPKLRLQFHWTVLENTSDLPKVLDIFGWPEFWITDQRLPPLDSKKSKIWTGTLLHAYKCILLHRTQIARFVRELLHHYGVHQIWGIVPKTKTRLALLLVSKRLGLLSNDLEAYVSSVAWENFEPRDDSVGSPTSPLKITETVRKIIQELALDKTTASRLAGFEIARQYNFRSIAYISWYEREFDFWTTLKQKIDEVSADDFPNLLEWTVAYAPLVLIQMLDPEDALAISFESMVDFARDLREDPEFLTLQVVKKYFAGKKVYNPFAKAVKTRTTNNGKDDSFEPMEGIVATKLNVASENWFESLSTQEKDEFMQEIQQFAAVVRAAKRKRESKIDAGTYQHSLTKRQKREQSYQTNAEDRLKTQFPVLYQAYSNSGDSKLHNFVSKYLYLL